jgi:hypothetical protein
MNKMAFSKGYLGGGKSEPKEEEPMGEPGEEGEGHDAEIESHLKSMHEKTGHGHSHIEHMGDGTHKAHHIDQQGQMSGPEETGDCPGGMCGGGM